MIVCPQCSHEILGDAPAAQDAASCPRCGGLLSSAVSAAGPQSRLLSASPAYEISPMPAPSAGDPRPAPITVAPWAHASATRADYIGLYINLDRSTERRERVEAQLRQFNLLGRYRRFSGVDGKLTDQWRTTRRPEELGCFLSHYEIARQHVGCQSPLHVIEDDVVLCRRTQEVVERVIKSQLLENYDIVFTDNYLAFQIDQIRQVKRLLDELVVKHGPIDADSFQGFTMLDLKNVLFAGTASYVVSPAAVAKLHDHYAAELQRGLSLPLDLFLRSLVHNGKLRAACVFPFVTSVRIEDIIDTTLPDRYEENKSVVAYTLLRHSFYIDCDWARCRELLKTIWQPRELSEHEDLISKLALHKLFGDYKPF